MARRRAAEVCLLALIALASAGCDDKLGVGTTPRIRVVPTSHAFGSVAVGQEEPVRVTVTNIGGGDLNVTSVQLTSTSSTDFALDPVTVPRKLRTNQSFTFDVVYRPVDVGADSGRVVIRSDDPASPSTNVELTTLDIGPRITVEPDTLDFGTVERGMTSSLSATIKNDGFADLIVDSLSTVPGSDFSVTAPTTVPFTLAPGATKQFTVAFTPTGCAAREEAVQIFSNDPNQSPFNVTVRGRPPGPAIGSTPTTVSFGAVNLGSSATQTVSLKNLGTAPLSISSVFTGIGTDPAFTITAPTTPAVLTASQTVDVTVAYHAAAAGYARGNLVVSSDDCEKPMYQIPLEAIGTEGPAALIQVSPSTLNFGNIAAGVFLEKTFTVTSIGSLPLTVSGVALAAGTTSEFSVVSGAAGFSLAACTQSPCPSQTVTARYSPTNTGADTGAMVVSSNAANTPTANVTLNGNGTAGATCVLRAAPQNLNFGDVALGSFKDLPITLTNGGTGNCTYDVSALSPFANLGGYGVQSQPGHNNVIGPGQTRQVVVRLAPPALNDLLFAFLFVKWNDPNQANAAGQATVTLIGRSVEAKIGVVPGRVDFGVITIGCASPVTSVKVYNTGSAVLTLSSIRLENSPSRFQIIQAPSAGTAVQGGAFAEVKLRYVPNASAANTDTLLIDSNDRARPTLRVPLTGTGTAIIDVVDKFVQATEPRVDILFMVDNSGSMSEEQTNLQNNFRAFAQFAQSLHVSYQIGVVTTDTGKLQGNPKIIRSTDADPVGEFGRNTRVGTNGDGVERGLEMAYQALSEPFVSADNAGFLRPDASLEIIALSDENDQSSGSIDFYTTYYLSIKGARNTNLFRFSAIVGDVPNGCQSANGAAETGSRYKDVVDRTGGVLGSICDASFANTLQAIGNRAFGQRAQFFLTRGPDLTQPLTVRSYSSESACDADPSGTTGTLVPQNPNTGYTYDAASNSIIFGASAVPPRGTCLKVKYKAACIAP